MAEQSQKPKAQPQSSQSEKAQQKQITIAKSNQNSTSCELQHISNTLHNMCQLDLQKRWSCLGNSSNQRDKCATLLKEQEKKARRKGKKKTVKGAKEKE